MGPPFPGTDRGNGVAMVIPIPAPVGGTDMEVRLITTTGAALSPLEDLARLLGSGAGFVWADIGEWDDAAEHVLTDTFHFNPMAIRDCSQRNQVPQGARVRRPRRRRPARAAGRQSRARALLSLIHISEP